jgi:hypothetical protein
MSLAERERQLVTVSRDALRWFKNRLAGSACNGANDDLHIARRLTESLSGYQDLPDPREPPHPQNAIDLVDHWMKADQTPGSPEDGR